MKFIFTTLIVAVLVAVGFAHFGPANTANAQSNGVNIEELVGRILNTIAKFVEEKVEEGIEEAKKFGAVPGPEVSSNCFKVGSVERCHYRVPFNATSSMVCQIPLNNTATSSLISFGARFTGGVSGTNLFYLSTTTSSDNSEGYGSSTPALIAGFSIPSGRSDISVDWKPNATTTRSNTAVAAAAGPLGTLFRDVLPSLREDGSSNLILGTSTWLTWRIATQTPGVFATPYTGFCNAIVESL